MRHVRKSWRLATFGLVAATAVVLVGVASGKPIDRGPFHDEGTFVDDDFCGVGLTVEGDFVVDGRFKVVTHGRDQLLYFMEHVSATTMLTNPDTDRSVTVVSNVLNKDLKVTDNGDGTLTVLLMATGNDVIYGADGKAIGRNPGQIRIEFLIDHAGTPDDPFDDEVISEEVVKGSTGRTDDFCEVVLPAIT
jgi:hypothetical protein